MSETVHERLDRLESLVEQQQETIEQQQQIIEDQRERIGEIETGEATPDPETSTATPDASGEGARTEEPNGKGSSLLSRRSLLTAAATVGLGGFATGAASASEPRGVIGTERHNVRRLYLQTLAGTLTNGQPVTTLAGDGLEIADQSLTATDSGPTVEDNGSVVLEDADRLNFRFNLNATEEDGEVQLFAEDTNTDTNTQTNVSDDGSTVVESTGDIDFGTNLSASDDGDGSVSVDATDTRTDVSDDGSTVVAGTDDIDFGANLSASDDGDGTATVDANVSAATNWEEADGDDLLEPVSPYTGIDVTDVQTDSLDGGVTGNTDLTSLQGNGLTIAGGSLDIESSGVGSAELASDSVTVAGNSVSLGSSVGVDYVDLSDTGSSFPIPNSDIANSSLSVAGNSVSLGGSVGIGHGDLSGVGTDDHHSKDHHHGEADISSVPNSGLSNSSLSVAGNSVSLGGSTDVNHADLKNIDSSDHHTRPSAVQGLTETASNEFRPTSTNTDTSTDSIVLPTNFSVTRTGSSTASSSSGLRHGVKFVPQYDTSSATITPDSLNDSGLTLYITDTSGSVLAQASSSPGDSTKLTASLSGGTGYYAVVDNGGSGFSYGSVTSTSFPYTSGAVEITKGITNDDFETTREAPAIESISLPSTNSLTQTVEFSDPTPVGRWETASFQAIPDGETVEVYVETSSDGGSTWSEWRSEPIGPGTDLSAISRDDRVRFRVELSRDSSSNRPRVTLLSRQWRP